MMNNLTPILLALLLSPIVHAVDPEHGKALHDEHCLACHGTDIYIRETVIPTTYVELKDTVDFWRTELDVDWSKDDIEDVAFYLNKWFYKFDCPHWVKVC